MQLKQVRVFILAGGTLESCWIEVRDDSSDAGWYLDEVVGSDDDDGDDDGTDDGDDDVHGCS